MITDHDIENWFTYHAPNEFQQKRYEKLRGEAKKFAQLILEVTPVCADQTVAIRKLRELVMTCNQAIACEE